MAEGDVLTTGLVVLDIDQKAGVARLACRVTGPGGMVLAEGEVEVLPPITAEERLQRAPCRFAQVLLRGVFQRAEQARHHLANETLEMREEYFEFLNKRIRGRNL